MDSSSSEEEDFEGFVVTPEEKLSYKAWTRKRRASEAFNDSSDDDLSGDCLLYTSPSPRDRTRSRMPSSA